MWDFEHGDGWGRGSRQFDISYTLPSACARALEAGTADIGIIPAAAYAQVPGLTVLPGVAIASRRPVRSILLVSRVPVDQIRTVALDTSSMTSVALTKILFEKWLGGGRTFTSNAARSRKNARPARRRISHWRSRAADRPLALPHPRPRRRMDSLYRQTLRLRLLGRSPASPPGKCLMWGQAGKCLVWGQPPPAVRVAKRRTEACARPCHDFSAIPRPRTRTLKPRPHRPRMGPTPRDQRSRCPLLPHRKHLLPPRPTLS